jgi:RNAse (barnase) inhibitor barstar
MTDEPIDTRPLDVLLLLSGPVTKYLRPDLLDRDVRWFTAHAYDVRSFDCTAWKDDEAMHDALARTLGFPDYYGKNLSALNDCLSEMDSPSNVGMVLVFRRIDAFVAHDRPSAQGLLDVVADLSRRALIGGTRILALVQSDDPRLELEPVGACNVLWNDAEWLDRSRGL